ncbi:MAG: FHA domain-containing protein, partial [Bdellovibrio sp.]
MKQAIILRIFRQSRLIEVKQFLQDQIIVGSDSGASLRLEGPGVSEFHCVIELRPQGFFVGDLGSAAGTLLQGEIVMDAPVSSGQKIGVGDFEIHFFVGVTNQQSVATETLPKAPSSPMAKIESPPVSEVVTEKAALVSPKKSSAATSVSISSRAVTSKSSTARAPRSSRGTYAPPSVVRDLRTYLKPSSGPVLEVVISWQERILNSLHFSKPELITLGS